MEVLVIDLIEIDTLTKPDEYIAELIQLVRGFNISAIEPELDEDITCITEGKYYFLSVLRDTFIEFKQLGDTKLLMTSGTCSRNCHLNCNKAYQFEGNNSKETFAFVVDASQQTIKEVHFCTGFMSDAGVKGDNYFKFAMRAAIKLAERRSSK